MKSTAFVLFLSCAWCAAQEIGDALVQPPVLEENDGSGLLDVSLSLDYATHDTAIHTMVDTRLFNGIMPGPTIKIHPGDRLRILFQNNLEEQPNQNTDSNEYSHPDDTNLHFHGAHVSGELPSDDVTLSIKPGDSYQYETDFPTNHMPGTHWVHPHVHGSGALQVGGGAALAMIVVDPPGYLPTQVEEAEDVLLFVQHMDLDLLQQISATSGDEKTTFTATDSIFDDRNGDFRLVNGQYQPTLTMQPGEWQRWRVVFGSWLRDPLDLAISGCEMQLLAKDGLYIQDFPRSINVAPIPTAGRADIMVRCPSTGSYTATDYSGETLFFVNVEGSDVSSSDLVSWTPTIPDYLENLVNTQPGNGCSCSTTFGVRNACTGGNFCVNGAAFDPTIFVHTIALGEVVERSLSNIGVHPYHQHVYPFQIVDQITGNNYFQQGDWHDVIYIDNQQGALTVRYQPTVHLGRVMLHCHRLDHEDQGMMSQEDVVDPASGGACSCNAFTTRVTNPPTSRPTSSPTSSPTDEPTSNPTALPTGDPTSGPTSLPTGAPTSSPTTATSAPAEPNEPATAAPTSGPTDDPTSSPTSSPTSQPTTAPTSGPTSNPTQSPSLSSGGLPACIGTDTWSAIDRRGNTRTCDDVALDRGRSCELESANGVTSEQACPNCAACVEGNAPTSAPTTAPTAAPTSTPTSSPTSPPTGAQTDLPTSSPTAMPTTSPTGSPTITPTVSPTGSPTAEPTTEATAEPTTSPTSALTSSPTGSPTSTPTAPPTGSPTAEPTGEPTSPPTSQPTTEAGTCEDSSTWFFIDRRGNPRTCQDVGVDRGDSCNANGDGTDTRSASEACPVTCGSCNSACEDSSTWSGRDNNGNTVTCADVSPGRGGGCNAPGTGGLRAVDACPVACNSC